jgi:PAS domain S-box-containing protein
VIYLVLLSFSCFLLSLFMGIHVLRLNPTARENRAFFWTALSMSLWSFCYTWFYPAQTEEAAWFWFRASQVFTLLFPMLWLHFTLVFTGSRIITRFVQINYLIYLPAIALILPTLFMPTYVEEMVLHSFGWRHVGNSGTFWMYWIMIYFPMPILASIVVILRWYTRKERSKLEKRQGAIVLFSIIIPLALNLPIKLISFMYDVYTMPEIVHIIIMIWLSGIFLAVVRYKVLTMSPGLAMESIFLQVNDFLVLIDMKGTIVKASEQFITRLYGKQGILSYHSIYSFVPEEKQVELLSNKLAEKNSFVMELLLGYGSNTIPVRLSAALVYDPVGDPIGWVLIAHDITDRRKLEQEVEERIQIAENLAKSEELYQLSIDSLQDYFLIVNSELEVVLGNRLVYKDFLARGNKNELTGNSIYEVLPWLDPASAQEYRRVFNTGKTLYSEESLTIDGKRVLMEIYKIPVKVNDSINNVITLVRDITEKKEAMELKLQHEKIESIGLLAGGIAHDFNNLLTAILGNIEIADVSSSADSRKQVLDHARNAIKKAKGLTSQLLTFSRGGAPLKTPGSIVELVRDVSGFVTTGASIQVIVNSDSGLWPLVLTRTRYQRLFRTLCSIHEKR